MNHAKKADRAPKKKLTPIERKLRVFKWLRWTCRAVVLATVTVSIWANLLHAWGGWVTYVIAALPPLLALGAWELVSRIPIRHEASRLVRWSRPSATIGIFGGAAFLSYFHQRDAFFRYTHGDESTAWVLPALIDGLMIVTSVSIYEVTARIEALDAVVNRPTMAQVDPDQVKVTTRREPNGRERVASVLTQDPTVTARELARRAGVSESYASTLAKELRSGNGAELVDAK
jgi:Protein of unknown function (DUF2637)